MYAKFSKKLAFLTPWYAHLSAYQMNNLLQLVKFSALLTLVCSSMFQLDFDEVSFNFLAKQSEYNKDIR